MRKYLQITVVILIILSAYYFKNVKITDDDEDNVTIQAATPTPTPHVLNVTSPTPTIQLISKYKDGTYDGSIEDAVYGDLQVEVVISSGRIVDVTELKYPNDNHTSIAINRQALTILRQEAIDRQSAEVDLVTGALDSAPAFKRSLENALNKAI